MSTAVVTVAHGRHGHLAAQRVSLASGTVRPDHHVIVAIEDPVLAGSDWCSASIPSTHLGLPLAAARNLGAELALERGATTLVFLDVDCLAGNDLVAGYAAVVAAGPDTVWSGPVTYLDPPPVTGYDLGELAELDAPHPARPAPVTGEFVRGADPDLFWSLSFACSARAWRRCGGFCEGYVGYGGEDTDFGRVVIDAGLDLGLVGAARGYHQWHPVSRPPVEYLDDIVRNAEIFRCRWGSTPMLGWLRDFERLGLAREDCHGRWHAVAWSSLRAPTHASAISGYQSAMEPIPETSEAVDEFGPFADGDLLQQLRENSERVKALVPDCVGMTVSSRAHDVIFTLVATSREIAVLDAFQYMYGGPCVDALEADRVMTYPTDDDVLNEQHWYDFAKATAAASVASTLTLPVITGGAVTGTINLYAASAHAFDGWHEDLARIFDAWAPGAVTNADLTFSTRKDAEQAPRRLREDLKIQVAVGIMSQRHSADLEEARELLRDAALRAGVREADLAAEIIEINRDLDPD